MHPLITDDAETQGAGKFQVEVNGSYGTDDVSNAGTTVQTVGSEVVVNLTYGAGENVDLFVEMPSAWRREKADNAVLGSERGTGDVSVGAKWRFLEAKEDWALALKPVVTLPAGDEEKGLGTGKTVYSVHLVVTKEFEPAEVELFLNVGYIRNENDVEEEENLWHLSFAAVFETVEDLYLAANVGAETNTDKAAGEDPVFGLLGIVYEAGEDFDLSLGIKAGLNDAETDLTYLAGVALRF
jgi:hypothetical protein